MREEIRIELDRILTAYDESVLSAHRNDVIKAFVLCAQCDSPVFIFVPMKDIERFHYLIGKKSRSIKCDDCQKEEKDKG